MHFGVDAITKMLKHESDCNCVCGTGWEAFPHSSNELCSSLVPLYNTEIRVVLACAFGKPGAALIQFSFHPNNQNSEREDLAEMGLADNERNPVKFLQHQQTSLALHTVQNHLPNSGTPLAMGFMCHKGWLWQTFLESPSVSFSFRDPHLQ